MGHEKENQAVDWAVIFDWDGVVIDSSEAHRESWELLAGEEQLALSDGHFERGFGLKSDAIIGDVLDWTTDPSEITRMTDRKEEFYRELVRDSGIQPLPGVTSFLDTLAQNRIPCGVGSSTPRKNIEFVAGLLGLQDRFSAIVAAEDVDRGKPDPQVFLEVAIRLQIEPSRCVVVEDAPAGIEAAVRAGMLAIGVDGSHGANALQQAHRVVSRLDELEVWEIESWLESRP